VSFASPSKKELDEFTAEEAAAIDGQSTCTARRKLRELMKQGRATRRAVTLNGVSGYYYRLT
jgi:predicted transcriptional regulator